MRDDLFAHEPRVPRKLLWCDAEANWMRLLTREDVSRLVRSAARTGLDALLLDVKPLSGEVLYKSRIAPTLRADDGSRPFAEFDLLDAAVSEAHAVGIELHAAVNVFSEGHRQRGVGLALENPEWQTVSCEVVRTVSVGRASRTVKWVDPLFPADEPVIYTRKHGDAVGCKAGNQHISVERGRVVRVCRDVDARIAVPEEGAVLSLPEGAFIDCRVGDPVSWRSETVFRTSQESCMPSYGIFVNPIGPARDHELAVIQEIVSNYDVDGVIFDRMRYPNLYADFSPESRRRFEEWLNRGSLQWPSDILAIRDEPWLPPSPGRYYKQWLEWRALQIREFADEATALVRGIKPGIRVGTYVGSWYDSYYEVGVNWGSRENAIRYPWMTASYGGTGYAELFDYMCTGCYYPVATRDSARGLGVSESCTVEAACQLSMSAVSGACPVYGGLYLLDYHEKPDAFRAAMDVAMEQSDGVMLFDLVYLEEYGWWPLLGEHFAAGTGALDNEG